MAILRVSYTYARDNLVQILDAVEISRKAVIIKRRGHEDIAVLPAGELQSLRETVHLLRSPENARRLLTAVRRALESSLEPGSIRVSRGLRGW